MSRGAMDSLRRVRGAMRQRAVQEGPQDEKGLKDQERQQLIEELLAEFDQRSAPEGSRLIELMRCEQNLLDALRVVRQEIERIVRARTDLDR